MDTSLVLNGLPWLNKVTYLCTYLVVTSMLFIYGYFLFFLSVWKQEGIKFAHDESSLLNLDNTLDRWILSFTQSLVQFVHQEMAGYSRFFLLQLNEEEFMSSNLSFLMVYMILLF